VIVSPRSWIKLGHGEVKAEAGRESFTSGKPETHMGSKEEDQVWRSSAKRPRVDGAMGLNTEKKEEMTVKAKNRTKKARGD